MKTNKLFGFILCVILGVFFPASAWTIGMYVTHCTEGAGCLDSAAMTSVQDGYGAVVYTDSDITCHYRFEWSSSAAETTESPCKRVLQPSSGTGRWILNSPIGSCSDIIPVQYMIADGVNDPGALTQRENLTYRKFYAYADDDLEFIWYSHEDLFGSTVQMRAWSIATDATMPSGEGVSWAFSGACSTTNDSHDPTLGAEANSEDTDLTGDLSQQWDWWISPWVVVTPTDLAPNSACKIRIARDTGDADDDYMQTIGLVWVEIKYQVHEAISEW